jgi:hypothetical protein
MLAGGLVGGQWPDAGPADSVRGLAMEAIFVDCAMAVSALAHGGWWLEFRG